MNEELPPGPEPASAEKPAEPVKSRAVQLTDFIHEIERLEAEKEATAEAIKNQFAQAKAKGFDPSRMRETIRRRKDEAMANEKDRTTATYLHAVRTTEAAHAASQPQPEST